MGVETLPERGDLVWLSFDPQKGREQRGRRPALVLSPISYHQKAGLMVVVPITSAVKGYRFEVPLPENGLIHGAILADQVRSVDIAARLESIAGQIDPSTLDTVRDRITALFFD